MNATRKKTAALHHDAIAQLAWRHGQPIPGQREIKRAGVTSKNAPAYRDRLAIRLAALARLGAARH